MQLYLSQSLSNQFEYPVNSANDDHALESTHHWYASSFFIEEYLCISVQHRISGYVVVFTDVTTEDLANFKQIFVMRILSEIGFIFNLSCDQQKMVEFAMNNYLPLPDFIVDHHAESELAMQQVKQQVITRYELTQQLPQVFEELFDVTIALNTEINNRASAIDLVQQYLTNMLDNIGIDLQLTATQTYCQQQIMPLLENNEDNSSKQSNIIQFPFKATSR
ncbi:DUF6933 domain-containing protein [Sinobacterium norvegicum]|nr:hypothetical protein [Sinobacterium norvegicum]